MSSLNFAFESNCANGLLSSGGQLFIPVRKPL
jgi:hypothetical protein